MQDTPKLQTWNAITAKAPSEQASLTSSLTPNDRLSRQAGNAARRAPQPKCPAGVSNWAAMPWMPWQQSARNGAGRFQPLGQFRAEMTDSGNHNVAR